MRPSTLTALLFAFIGSACGGIDNVTVKAEGRTTVPAATPVEELLGDIMFVGDFASFDITETEEFKNQGYSRDQIDSVKVSRFSLFIEDPPSGNFDFLERISFFVESEGLPRVKIAERDPTPEGVAEMDLDLFDEELADYAAAESMSITTEASGRRPSEETTVRAEVVLNVDVNVDGAL